MDVSFFFSRESLMEPQVFLERKSQQVKLSVCESAII